MAWLLHGFWFKWLWLLGIYADAQFISEVLAFEPGLIMNRREKLRTYESKCVKLNDTSPVLAQPSDQCYAAYYGEEEDRISHQSPMTGNLES